jgi:hypothetical protein
MPLRPDDVVCLPAIGMRQLRLGAAGPVIDEF